MESASLSSARFVDGRFFHIEGGTPANAKAVEELCKKLLSEEADTASHSLTEGSITVTLFHTGKGRTGIFASLATSFSRFVSWIKGEKSTDYRPYQRAFFQSVLKVVGNEDDSRLADLFSKKVEDQFSLEEAPLSAVLSLWQESLQDSSITDSLQKLIEYQKRIEEIAQPRFFRIRSLEQKKLVTQIHHDLMTLQNGETLFIPSGIVGGRSKKTEHVLCKVTKTGDTYQMEYFGLSDIKELSETKVKIPDTQDEQAALQTGIKAIEPRRSTVKKEQIPSMQRDQVTSEQAHIVIEELVYSATTPVEVPSGNVSFVEMLRKSIKAKFSREIEPLGTALASIGEPPVKQKLPIKLREKSLDTAHSAARVYIKVLGQGKDLKNERVKYRYKAFMTVWNDAVSQNAHLDPVVRSYFAQAIDALLRHSDKISEEEKENLQKVLQRIIELDLQGERGVLAQTSSKDRPPIQLDIPKTSPTFRPLKSQKALSADGIERKYFDITNVGQFKKSVLEPLQTLVAKGEFEKAHFHLAALMKTLGDTVRSEEWIVVYEEIAGLVQTVSYGLGRLVSSAEDLSYQLRCLKAMDQSFRSNPKNPTVGMNITPIISLLGNVYTDLGEYSDVIHDTITYFKKCRYTPYTGWFEDPWVEKDFNVYKVLDSATVSMTLERCQELSCDINATGPARHLASFMAMRRSYLLLQAFIAPTRLFIPVRTTDFVRIVTQTAEAKEISLFDPKLLEEGLPAMMKGVQQFLLDRKGKISFSFLERPKINDKSFLKRLRTNHKRTVEIKPFGLSLYPPDDSLSEMPIGSRRSIPHPQLAKDEGMTTDPALDQACFTTAIVEKKDVREPRILYQRSADGPISSATDDTEIFLDGTDSFVGITEWEILEDQTSLSLMPKEVSDELKLLQTDPKNRTQNTIGFISKHIGLLNDEKIGPSLMRLFSRNIFQYGSFGALGESLQRWCFDELKKAIILAGEQKQDQAFIYLMQLYRKMGGQKKSWSDDLLSKQQERLLKISGILEREAIQEALLLHDAGILFDKEKLLPKLVRFLQLSPPKGHKDPIKEAKTKDALKRLSFEISEDESAKEMCVTLCPGTEEKDWKPLQGSVFLFQNKDTVVDLYHFQIIQAGHPVVCSIPSAISSFAEGKKIAAVLQSVGCSLENPVYKKTRTEMTFEGKTVQGDAYELEKDAITYKIFIGDDQSVVLFRKRTGAKVWDQYLTKPIVDAAVQKDFPLFLLQKDCWAQTDGKRIFIEEKGKVLFHIDSTKPSMVIQTADGKKCIQPSRASHGQLLDIEEKGYISIVEDPLTVRYPRLSLTYVRNAEGQMVSQEHSGFVLSKEFLGKKDPLLEKFFHPAFSVYHLLEKPNVPSRILMPKAIFPVSTHKTQSQIFTPSFAIEPIPVYTFDLDPVHHVLVSESPEANLYLAYTLIVQGNYKDGLLYLDRANIHRPIGEDGKETLSLIRNHLLSLPETPEIFALRARLFVCEEALVFKERKAESSISQSRSVEASFLLKKLEEHRKDIQLSLAEESVLRQCKTKGVLSFMGHVSESPEKYALWKKIPDLISGVMDDTLEGIKLEDLEGKTKDTVLTYFKDHSVLAKLVIEGVITEEEAKNSPISEIKFVYECMHAENIQEKLQKKPQVINEGSVKISRYEALVHLAKWKEIKEKILDPFEITFGEIVALGQHVSSQADITSVQALFRLAPIRVAYEAQHRIAALQKQIAEAPRARGIVSKELRNPQLLFPDMQALFAISATPSAQAVPPKTKGSYADELLEGLEADVVAFENRQKEAIKVVPGTDLTAAVSSQITVQKEVALAAKNQLLGFIPTKEGVFTSRIGRKANEAVFETILRLYGEGKLDRLPEYGIAREKEDEVAGLCRQYLESSIKETAALKAEKLCKEGKEKEAVDILTSSFQYDPKKDPLAPVFLLFEYELGFVCRASQIAVVCKNLETRSCFTQEMCGGGKTTVIRHLFSRLKADGYFLSGVMTLDALRSEHGLQYARTTKQAYGETVFDFRFSQTTSTDRLSLLQLHENLLRTTVERGRIDVSRGDLQSFRNALHIKYEKLLSLRQRTKTEKGERLQVLKSDIETLHGEIDIMEDIRDFMQEHLVLMSDELDQDCDVTQEKNVSHGDKEPLVQQQRDAVIEVVQCCIVSQDPTIQEMFKAARGNTHRTFGKAKEAIYILAGEMYDAYTSFLPEVSKEQFQKYLTDPTSDAAKDVYEKFFKNKTPLSEELSRLAYIRVFLSEILPPYFSDAAGVSGSGVSGVSYGRSKVDGVSVIPYGGSDKPKEGSLHGNELVRLWLTCMDYQQEGLSLQQIRASYIQAKSEALAQIKQAVAEKAALSMEETAAVTRFKKAFNIQKPFEEITDQDFPEIVRAMNENPQKIAAYVAMEVLPKMFQHRQKIVSDAQDVSDMVHEHSGSSGTDTAAAVLPDKIDIRDARQSGVHGEIIKALTMSVEGQAGKNPVFIDEKKDRGAQLALLLTGGDCLSDVGRFFPGKPALEIARDLLKQLPEGSTAKKIVFMDEQDRWKILQKTQDGVEVIPYTDPKGDEVELKSRITIFDDPHTRGAERHSMAGVTEFVTLDVDTDWSRFEQGVMRERQLTKGGANVRFIITAALKEKMRAMGDKSEFEKLKIILCQNEAARLKQLHYTAERQKIKHVVKDVSEKALRAISKQSRSMGLKRHHAVREAMYQEMHASHIFLVEATLTPEAAACPQKMEDTDTVLDTLVDRQLVKLQTIDMAAYSQIDVRNPVSIGKLKDSLETLRKDLAGIRTAFKELQKTLTTLQEQKKTATFRSFLPDLSKEVEELKEKEDYMLALEEKEQELQKLVEQLSTMEDLSRETGIDFFEKIRTELEESRKQLTRTSQDLEEKIYDLKIKCGKALEEKPAEKATTLSASVAQLVQKGIKAVEKEARKAAVALLDRGPANRLIQQTQEKMDALAGALGKTESTTQTLVDFGGSMVGAASTIFKEGKKRLTAKKSLSRKDGRPGRVSKDMLPEKVVDSALDVSGEEQVETEQEQSQEVSEEVFGLQAADRLKKIFEYQDVRTASGLYLQGGDPSPGKIHTLTQEVETTPFSAMISDKSIAYTENFCPKQRTEGKKPFFMLRGKFLQKPSRIPTRTIFSLSGSQVRQLLPAQADFTYAKLLPTMSIYNFGTESFEGGFPTWIQTKDQAEAVAEQIALMKLFRGDIDFISLQGDEKEKVALDTFHALQRLLRKVPEDKRDDVVKQIKMFVRVGSYEGSSLERAVKEAYPHLR